MDFLCAWYPWTPRNAIISHGGGPREAAPVPELARPTGALNRSGSNLASYLLFEESFCRALVDLGYQDTIARANEVVEFFAGGS
jgi:hypothetical protein